MTQYNKKIDFSVSLDGVEDFENGLIMASTIFIPKTIDYKARQPVIFLFPGAGYTRKYFDMNYSGFDGYSQCSHHAAAGIITVAVDHLGVGDSSTPSGSELKQQQADALTEGPPSLTREIMADACAAVVRHVMAGLRAGTIDPALPSLAEPGAIGAGQSMGGFIVTVTQARHGCFAAIALLGSSMTLTSLAMKPGHRTPFRSVAPAERLNAIGQGFDITASFHWPDEPEELVRADMDFTNLAPWRTLTVPTSSARLAEPLSIATEAASVRVPVLLVYGEQDVTIEPLADLSVFRSTYDLSLLLIPRMAHMHNFADTRARLWRRLEEFARFAEPVQ